jgi:hypothetical protein
LTGFHLQRLRGGERGVVIAVEKRAAANCYGDCRRIA